MKTRTHSTRWLGLVLACSAITFAAPTQAGKPAKPPPPQPAPAYVTVLLGGLRASGGHVDAASHDLNNHGQVVGGACGTVHYMGQAFLLNPVDANEDGTPDSWFVDAVDNATGASGADGQNDLMIGLGNLPGASLGGGALAINDLGWIVGASSYQEPTRERAEAYIVVPKDNSWYQDLNGDGSNDLMTPLGSVRGNGESSRPTDINELGQVVGSCSTLDDNGVRQERGFLLIPEDTDGDGVPDLWFRAGDATGANAMMIDLGALVPEGINNHGQIVGTAGGRAMLRNPDGSLIDLGAPGVQSWAMTINNRGQIGVPFRLSLDIFQDGYAGLLTPLDGDNDGAPDTWYQDLNGDLANDLIVDLGKVPRSISSGIGSHAVNDAGSVVAVSINYRSAHYWRAPFLWQNGVLQSLKDLTGGTIDFWDVYAINNAGQIICVASGEEFVATGGACILLPTR